MTKKALVKIIQEVVKREVQKEVKKIFIEEQTKSVIEPKVETKKKNYTKNKSLNDVLNETVGLSKKQSDSEEYPTLGGGTFDSSRMAELMGYGKSEEVKRDMVAVDTFKKAGVSSEQMPDHITKALTRDYSDLMKHDKMKGK